MRGFSLLARTEAFSGTHVLILHAPTQEVRLIISGFDVCVESKSGCAPSAFFNDVFDNLQHQSVPIAL